MIATWSDEDQSEDDEENSSSSANEELCFMANSSDGKDSQRKGAKEIHKHLMAKKSFNESRKSTIQKTLALTAHSKSSEHSASSPENKSSNGSTRSGKSIPDPFINSNSDSDADEGMSYAELVEFWTNIYCKGSVDTPHTGVDTMLKALSQKMKRWSTSVDTRPGQVDTRDRSQRNKSTDFFLRSTLDAVRSTLESLPRRPVDTLRKLCDLKFLLDMWLLGFRGFDLREPIHFQKKPFWRPKGVFQICLHLQKLQAILSRGSTRESRGIPGEKLAVQGKGADPTEEAQEKKDFWHFRCHPSRASPIEENLHRFPSRLLN
ncbi:hypothetical protein Taro_029511 [Colocasia esculenta]|uniref:Uncharacterized protein n=1 Tax=Colocasia esculenta TaxID=4460 RepID=A0A843VE03_COLES|nr:hypothetical protein [Colocasia esculenta]